MKDDIYIIIRDNIKKYREELGYSIKDLSICTNIDFKYLEDIEKNGVDENITFETLNKICNCLNISMSKLFKKSDD